MKKIKKLFIIIIAGLLLLSGCRGTPTDGSEEQGTSEAELLENPEESGAAVISVAYADHDILSNPDTYDELVDDSSENAVKVVFTSSRAVKNFKLLEIAFIEAEEGEAGFEITGELYSTAELAPSRPLVATLAFAGDMPDTGISFEDEDGTQRFYSLSMSGRDGSLLLLEEEMKAHVMTAEELRIAELAMELREKMPVTDGSTSAIPLDAAIRAGIFGITPEEAELDVIHTTSYESLSNLLKARSNSSTAISSMRGSTVWRTPMELSLS